MPGIPGAAIRKATLPESLRDGVSIGPFTEAKPGALQFTIPRIARYRIEGGNTIDVAPLPKADPAAVALFAYGSARGTLIHQRGELPLEATTLISPQGACIALCSFSGIGKSTVAAALCGRGWTLLSDGIARITVDDRQITAWPGSARLALWRDACERLGLDTAKLVRVRRGLDKFTVDVAHTTATAPLRAIVKLRVAPSASMVELPAAHRAATIVDHVFRVPQVIALGTQDKYARAVTQLANDLPVFHLGGAQFRPVEEVADHLAGAFA